MGWGGLPVILVGLVALLFLSSAAHVARRGGMKESGALSRILRTGGIAALVLFGASVIVLLFAEAVQLLGRSG